MRRFDIVAIYYFFLFSTGIYIHIIVKIDDYNKMFDNKPKPEYLKDSDQHLSGIFSHNNDDNMKFIMESECPAENAENNFEKIYYNQFLNRIPKAKANDTSANISAPEIWSKYYLSNSESLEVTIDYKFTKKLAKASKNHGSTLNSKGFCLRGVRTALHKVLKDNFSSESPDHWHALPADSIAKTRKIRVIKNSPGRSAENFKRWARSNPVGMCLSLNLGDITNAGIPKLEGSIYVYGKGKCGFDPVHGHIEILVDAEENTVCSDHCRTNIDFFCRPDLILVPVRSCDFLFPYQHLQNEKIFENYSPRNKDYKVPSWHIDVPKQK